MNNKRITLRGCAQARTEEKKSVFIAYAAPVSSEEEAKKIIEEKKKEYSDATHNVWAYYIGGGAHARYSDDGEPQGTAGMPILNVLKMSGADDLLCVVTRYFGGTLLGAGGLVRAYGAAARAAIEKAGLCENESFTVFEISIGFKDYQKLTVQLKQIKAIEDSADFTNEVKVTVAIETEREEILKNLVCELTCGKNAIKKIKTEERPSQNQ